jgi:hypothetical protein
MPMRYFEWEYKKGRSEENHLLSQEVFTSIEEISTKENISQEEVMAKFRIAPDMYINECEWYTFDSIPVNNEFVNKIVFFVPYVIRNRKHDTFFNCEQSGGNKNDKYAIFENQFAFGIEDFLDWIRDVRNFVAENGFVFEVDSQYPYIKINGGGYPSSAIIDFTEENARKLSEGQMPVVTYLGEGEKRGCRR